MSSVRSWHSLLLVHLQFSTSHLVHLHISTLCISTSPFYRVEIMNLLSLSSHQIAQVCLILGFVNWVMNASNVLSKFKIVSLHSPVFTAQLDFVYFEKQLGCVYIGQWKVNWGQHQASWSSSNLSSISISIINININICVVFIETPY